MRRARKRGGNSYCDFQFSKSTSWRAGGEMARNGRWRDCGHCTNLIIYLMSSFRRQRRWWRRLRRRPVRRGWTTHDLAERAATADDTVMRTRDGDDGPDGTAFGGRLRSCVSVSGAFVVGARPRGKGGFPSAVVAAGGDDDGVVLRRVSYAQRSQTI